MSFTCKVGNCCAGIYPHEGPCRWFNARNIGLGSFTDCWSVDSAHLALRNFGTIFAVYLTRRLGAIILRKQKINKAILYVSLAVGILIGLIVIFLWP